jgi:hypothetical protein
LVMGEGALRNGISAYDCPHNRLCRECIGMHFAQNTLYLAAATMLALFDFGKDKDEHGNGIEIRAEYTEGFLTYVVTKREVLTRVLTQSYH